MRYFTCCLWLRNVDVAFIRLWRLIFWKGIIMKYLIFYFALNLDSLAWALPYMSWDKHKFIIISFDYSLQLLSSDLDMWVSFLDLVLNVFDLGALMWLSLDFGDSSSEQVSSQSTGCFFALILLSMSSLWASISWYENGVTKSYWYYF